MKRIILAVAFAATGFFSVLQAQDATPYKHMFRFYYDNDLINLAGKGTDNEYTGGNNNVETSLSRN